MTVRTTVSILIMMIGIALASMRVVRAFTRRSSTHVPTDAPVATNQGMRDLATCSGMGVIPGISGQAETSIHQPTTWLAIKLCGAFLRCNRTEHSTCCRLSIPDIAVSGSSYLEL